MASGDASQAPRYRVGIVGCGEVARQFHAPAFAAQPDFTIVGCVSRRLESAHALARGYNAATYPTTEALIEAADPDLVVVTTHEAARLDPLEVSLGAQRHLFVEKPLYAHEGQDRITVDDYRSARAALEVWDRQRSTFGINFNYRTMPHMQRMRADIVDGVLGEILSVNACAHLACWSHVIDLVQWWLGEIVTVSALISTRGERLDRICTVSFPTGVVGSLEGAAGVFERKSLLRVQVRGSLARGVVEGVNGSYRRLRESSDALIEEWPCPDVAGDYYSDSFARSIGGYCTALRAGAPPPVSADDGLSELAVEAAVHRSATSGRPVQVASI